MHHNDLSAVQTRYYRLCGNPRGATDGDAGGDVLKAYLMYILKNISAKNYVAR